VTDLDRRQAERVAQSKAARDHIAPKPSRQGTTRRDDGQRWAILNAFVDGALAELTEAEVRVWLVVYREVKPGGIARIGMGQIARLTGIKRRSVARAMDRLKHRGMVEIVSRGCINGTPNAYRLHISQPSDPTVTTLVTLRCQT